MFKCCRTPGAQSPPRREETEHVAVTNANGKGREVPLPRPRSPVDAIPADRSPVARKDDVSDDSDEENGRTPPLAPDSTQSDSDSSRLDDAPRPLKMSPVQRTLRTTLPVDPLLQISMVGVAKLEEEEPVALSVEDMDLASPPRASPFDVSSSDDDAEDGNVTGEQNATPIRQGKDDNKTPPTETRSISMAARLSEMRNLARIRSTLFQNFEHDNAMSEAALHDLLGGRAAGGAKASPLIATRSNTPSTGSTVRAPTPPAVAVPVAAQAKEHPDEVPLPEKSPVPKGLPDASEPPPVAPRAPTPPLPSSVPPSQPPPIPVLPETLSVQPVPTDAPSVLPPPMELEWHSSGAEVPAAALPIRDVTPQRPSRPRRTPLDIEYERARAQLEGIRLRSPIADGVGALGVRARKASSNDQEPPVPAPAVPPTTPSTTLPVPAVAVDVKATPVQLPVKTLHPAGPLGTPSTPPSVPAGPAAATPGLTAPEKPKAMPASRVETPSSTVSSRPPLRAMRSEPALVSHRRGESQPPVSGTTGTPMAGDASDGAQRRWTEFVDPCTPRTLRQQELAEEVIRQAQERRERARSAAQGASPSRFPQSPPARTAASATSSPSTAWAAASPPGKAAHSAPLRPAEYDFVRESIKRARDQQEAQRRQENRARRPAPKYASLPLPNRGGVRAPVVDVLDRARKLMTRMNADWSAFETRVAAGDEIRVGSVPWIEDVRAMFRGVATLGHGEVKSLFRELSQRWHPDKFAQRFGPRIAASDKILIMTRVKESFQRITEARDEVA